MLSEIFYSLVLTTSAGLLLAILRILYKSKCKHIKLFCCELDRDVELEEKFDEIEQLHNNSNNENNRNNQQTI